MQVQVSGADSVSGTGHRFDFLPHPRLQTIQGWYCYEPCWGVFTGFVNLQTLSLACTILAGSYAESAIPTLSALKHVDLTGTHIGDRSVYALAALGSLEVLKIDMTRATLQFAVCCISTGFSSLRELHMRSKCSVPEDEKQEFDDRRGNNSSLRLFL